MSEFDKYDQEYQDLSDLWSLPENKGRPWSGKSKRWFQEYLNYEGKPPGDIEALKSLGVKWLK